MRIDGPEIVGSLTTSGDSVEINAPSGSISDLEVVRLTETSALIYKDNVQTLDSSEALFNLRPVSFNWKSDNREDIGLVADEVKEVYPQLVKSDAEGNALGVNYSKLTAILIKAVQDLSSRISSLESR